MKLLTWQEFNHILISNSIERIRPKQDAQLFLQHYEAYFKDTSIGTGRAVNIEIREHVNFSSLDIKLKNDLIIPNEYPTPVIALYLCISGKVEVDFGNESLSGGRWGVYSVPAGTYNFRVYGTQEEKKYQVIGVHFSHESFQKFLGNNYFKLPHEITQSIENLAPYAKTGSYPIELHDRVLQLTNYNFDKLHDKLKLEGLIYEVMSYVVESFKDSNPKLDRNYFKAMDDFCKVILEEPFSPPSKTILAQNIGMSESQFYKVFKSIYGISPNQFMIDNKLLAARTLLETEDISVKEVAFRCGYESVSSFSRVFKKRFGFRPGEIIRERT
jgi:AraC-like DNA-binding protein